MNTAFDTAVVYAVRARTATGFAGWRLSFAPPAATTEPVPGVPNVRLAVTPEHRRYSCHGPKPVLPRKTLTDRELTAFVRDLSRAAVIRY